MQIIVERAGTIIYYSENYTEDPPSNAARVSALLSIVAALHYLCMFAQDYHNLRLKICVLYNVL